MLKNVSISETFKKWCDCHTCIKLPIVTAVMVCVVVYLME